MIPWDQIKEKYSLTFDNPIKGNPDTHLNKHILSILKTAFTRLH